MEQVTSPTITAFLLARIAEDEATALHRRESPWFEPEVVEPWRLDAWMDSEYPESSGIDVSAARVLAECKAKRAIIERFRLWEADNLADLLQLDDWLNGRPPTGSERTTREREGDGLDIALRALASVYADHPDYNPQWALNA